MSNETEGKKLASDYRRKNKLGNQPLPDLIGLIEKNDSIDIAIVAINNQDAHGVMAHNPVTNVTMIIAATTSSPVHLRSTIAHELGHFLAKDSLVTAANGDEEIRANAFARHFLLPLEAVTDFAQKSYAIDKHLLSDLVQMFQVSPQIASIQLLNKKYIDKTLFDQWRGINTFSLATEYGWVSAYKDWQRSSSLPKPPQKLLRRFIKGYVEGEASIEMGARLQQTTVEDAKATFQRANIFPPVSGKAIEITQRKITGRSAALDLFDKEFEGHE